jgi:hypothetical protein
MAATYCLAILAGFCFHSQDVDAKLQDTGLGYALTVKTLDYEARTSQTDVIRAYDWRQEPKACADEKCVRYHKSCSKEARAMICDFRIAFIGETAGGTISIRAKNEAGMQAAQREISLWFGSDAQMLMLSSLVTSSPIARLAACPAGTDPISCNPP